MLLLILVTLGQFCAPTQRNAPALANLRSIAASFLYRYGGVRYLPCLITVAPPSRWRSLLRWMTIAFSDRHWIKNCAAGWLLASIETFNFGNEVKLTFSRVSFFFRHYFPPRVFTFCFLQTTNVDGYREDDDDERSLAVVKQRSASFSRTFVLIRNHHLCVRNTISVITDAYVWPSAASRGEANFCFKLYFRVC